jgi:hypothetical protein
LILFEYGSLETVSILCEYGWAYSHTTTEDAILAAICNYSSGSEILQFLVDQQRQIPVTVDTIIVAGEMYSHRHCSRRDVQKALSSLIFETSDVSPDSDSELIRVAVIYEVADENLAASLFRVSRNLKPTLLEDLMIRIATKGNTATLQLLFHEYPSLFQGSVEWLKLLARVLDPPILTPLETFLCQLHTDIGLSEEVLEIISHIQIPPVCAVLSQPNNQVAITDELILYCARRCRTDILLSLLQRGSPSFNDQFCQNLIDSAVLNVHIEDIMHSLIALYSALRFSITERTIITAKTYPWSRFTALDVLLRCPESKVTVAREAWIAAAKNSEDLLGLFFSRAKRGCYQGGNQICSGLS